MQIGRLLRLCYQPRAAGGRIQDWSGFRRARYLRTRIKAINKVFERLGDKTLKPRSIVVKWNRCATLV